MPIVDPAIRTDYLDKVYDVKTFVAIVDNTIRVLKKLKKEIPFDAIAFTGTSGAAVAYPLSYRMQLPLICIRKPTDNSHYFNSGNGEIEGFVHTERYLIIDDFTCSGDTLHRIINVIAKDLPQAECVAIALYTWEVSRERRPLRHTFSDRSILVPMIGTREPDPLDMR
jgi:adenine/guanine phosphoribosyltransferase-like PRPP-binding protein